MQRRYDHIDIGQGGAGGGNQAHSSRGRCLLSPGGDCKSDGGVGDRCRHGVRLSGAPPQVHMGRALAGDMLHCFVAQCGQIDTCVESCAGTHENRSDRQVQLVDQPGAQILPNRRDPAAQPNVAIAGGISGLLQRRVNTVGDEAKHPERILKILIGPGTEAVERDCEATDPEFRHCALIYLGELDLQVRANPSAASASATASRRATRFTAGGTHRGKGTTRSSCRPLAVWTSRTAARSRRAKLRASRTSAGHNRRCTYVIFPPTSRQTSTSAESRTARVSQKICFPLAWPHKLPAMRLPTTASARFGTGPRALSRTTPWRFTNERAERRVTLRPSDCPTVRPSVADPATSPPARRSPAPKLAVIRRTA